MLTRDTIATAVADYIGEIAGNIPNIPLKILLGTAARTARANPASLDGILNSALVKMIMPVSEDGKYPAEELTEALQQSMQDYGQLTITIPPIPLISKAEQTLTFTPADVERLRNHLMEVNDHAER